MKVFQTDHNGFLVGETVADPDPMDEGNWLIPGGCVEQEPPALSDGQRAKFASGAWLIVDPEPVVEPEPEPELPPTKAEQEELRRLAYTAEADPLFFKWQAGEATESDWLAKRQEIRDRYPYPAE
jgi:hypothetical protein